MAAYTNINGIRRMEGREGGREGGRACCMWHKEKGRKGGREGGREGGRAGMLRVA